MSYFETADILLPKKIKNNWAVIACDQFTSDEKYWEETKREVGDDYSTLNLVLPEIYLEKDTEKSIEEINNNMKKYLEEGVFEEYKNSMIFVSRKQSDGFVLDGIVGCVNLDDYDYKKGAKKPIRASEKTVLERIPPRVKIRKDAPLEFPHILLLIDDPKFSVVESTAKNISENQKLYDLDLMQGGGNVKGYLLNEEQISAVKKAVENLAKGDDKLVFAVGDGNHSLATAKKCAENSSSALSKQALVEIVNIHSKAINFEPIYRVLFNCDVNKVLEDFVNENGGEYNGENAQYFTACFGENKRKISIKPTAKLPVGTLQKFLDEYLQKNPQIKIDYIHGEEDLINLCKEQNTLGFLFEGMKKDELFEAIKADGSLPRKTFSMGHARDKRYYIEGRKIK